MRIAHTPLAALAEPAAIALFGASPDPDSLGNGLLRNLAEGGFDGTLHLISDRHTRIGDRECHRSLDTVPGQIPLALVATPAASVPELLEACEARGVLVAVIYCAGLRPESAPEAAARLAAIVARGRLRLFGPRAFGCILPHAALNLTPIARPVPAGNLALVAQSTALCAHVLDWNLNDEFGFSAVFAPGETIDLDLPEILDHLARDPKTESILLYLETLRDARRFLSAARAAASVKPVIALRAGRGAAARQIAERHGGVAAGRDDAFDAALRRVGVLRVSTIGELFSAARALTTPRKPQGNRLAIVCNGLGPAVIAADQAEVCAIALAEPGTATLERLQGIEPRTTARNPASANPVDLLFDATPRQYSEAIATALDDPGTDGALAIFAPTTYADPLAVAQALIAVTGQATKPVLACWLGERDTGQARTALAQARVPVFRTPENAVTAFAFMATWRRNQALVLETPAALGEYSAAEVGTARSILDAALAQGRETLSQDEAMAVLDAFHIPAGTARAAGPTERELSLSIRPDPTFGPVLTLSEAGLAPYIYDARSVALPPLNARLVEEMLDVPHVARLLGPLPGRAAVARGPLGEVLLRLSELASELPGVRALEIRTLIAGSERALATDVAITIRPCEAPHARYGHMAIFPWPSTLVASWALKDASRCTIRPIRPEDAANLQNFVRGLSEASKRYRYFSSLSELSRHELARATRIDYARELTLIATRETADGPEMIGEAHYATLPDGRTCEFAVVIADALAGKGLGSRLMRSLMQAARDQGLETIRGEVMANNEPMLALMESLDFMVYLTDDESMVEVSRTLDDST